MVAAGDAPAYGNLNRDRVRSRTALPRAPSQEVGTVADQLPPSAWHPFVLREGSRGPQAVLCAVLRVAARRGLEPGPDVWRRRRRNPATAELKGYLAHGPADMPAERLVWLAGLAPPRHARHAGPLLRGAGDAAAPKNGSV